VAKVEPTQNEESKSEESANQVMVPSAISAGNVENLAEGIMQMTIHEDLINEVERKLKVKKEKTRIGSGAYGSVYKVSAWQKNVAVKKLKASGKSERMEVHKFSKHNSLNQ
jgi:hypothetical protein